MHNGHTNLCTRRNRFSNGHLFFVVLVLFLFQNEWNPCPMPNNTSFPILLLPFGRAQSNRSHDSVVPVNRILPDWLSPLTGIISSHFTVSVGAIPVALTRQLNGTILNSYLSSLTQSKLSFCRPDGWQIYPCSTQLVYPSICERSWENINKCHRPRKIPARHRQERLDRNRRGK